LYAPSGSYSTDDIMILMRSQRSLSGSTLLIQRANRRDTLALHAKLDELLRVDNNARSELPRPDDRP
jgi:hypothetical protein